MTHLFNWFCYSFKFILSVALIFDLAVLQISVFQSVDLRPPTSESLGSLLETQRLGLHPRPPEQKYLGSGAQGI